jgi:hypothetical protein
MRYPGIAVVAIVDLQGNIKLISIDNTFEIIKKHSQRYRFKKYIVSNEICKEITAIFTDHSVSYISSIFVFSLSINPRQLIRYNL